MNKLFSDSEEKFVNAEIFYADKTDSKLYSDEDLSVAAKPAEVYNAFLKGLLVVNLTETGESGTVLTAYYRPVLAEPTYTLGEFSGVNVHAVACAEAESPASGYVAVCSIFTA